MSKAHHWRAQAEQCFKMAADGEPWAKAALRELAADYIKLAEAKELTETSPDDLLTPELTFINVVAHNLEASHEHSSKPSRFEISI